MGSFGVWRWAGAAAAVVLWAAAAPGQSLWPEGGRSLFTDHRASAVGDLVTVVVNEVVAAQTQTKTSQARSIQLDLGGGSGFLSLLPGGGFQSGQDASANRAVGSTVAVQARVRCGWSKCCPTGCCAWRANGSCFCGTSPTRYA